MPKPEDTVRYEKFTGLRNNVSSDSFDVTDLEVADNIDIDAAGGVARRAGRTRYSATATHSLWGDREIALCVQGTTLYRVNTDYSLTAIKTGLTTGRRMAYTRINDLVYMTNGVESFVLDGGRVRSWGLPVPPYPTLLIGTGNMPAGTYQLTTTYQRNDGQESGARIAARFDSSVNGSITLGFVPPTDPDVVQHNVYLSPPNGDVMYLALEVPVANASAVYAGDTSEFAYPLKTQFLSAPQPGALLGYYRGCALVAVDNMIFPSESFAYELYDPRNYIPADGKITLLAPLEDSSASGIFVGTDRSTGILVGDEPGKFRYVPRENYGTIFGAQTMIDGSLFDIASPATDGKMLPTWQSLQGLCIGLPGMEIRNLTRTKVSLTNGVNGTMLFMPGPNRLISVSSQ